jgi:hypothetical protein
MVDDILKTAEVASKLVKDNSNIFQTLFPAIESKRLSLEMYRTSIINSNLSDEEKALALSTSHIDLNHKINQYKIAKLAVENAKEGTNFSLNSGIDISFIDKYMDQAKFVYDEEIQILWAKVLAGEFEKPNSTPFSVVRILSEITKRQAEAFSYICSLCVNIVIETSSTFFPLIHPAFFIFYNTENRFFNNSYLNIQTINDLDTIGLIKFNQMGFLSEYKKIFTGSGIHINYGNVTKTISDYEDNKFPVGDIILTSSGKALMKAITARFIDGWLDQVITDLEKRRVKFSDDIRVELHSDNNGNYEIIKLTNDQ